MGWYTLTVSTTADTTPATSSIYTVHAGQQVSQASVALTDHAPGVAANYTVGFTSSTLGSSSEAAQRQDIRPFPSGSTTRGMVGPSSLTDITANKVVGNCFS